MKKIPRAIGIDLGTTNSVMAILRAGEPSVVKNKINDSLTPSAVSTGRRGELLVGQYAKRRAYDPNTILSVKRFMGMSYDDKNVQKALDRVTYRVVKGPGGEVMLNFNNRAYTPTEISAMILLKLRQDAQDRLGEAVGRAVITVPAYFNDAQVAATRDAGRMAGFTVLSIIREPTAAALSFGLDRSVESDPGSESATVLVYDLGGGTFDISLMMMTKGVFYTVGIEGDKFLGGDDFDLEIMNRLYKIASGGGNLAEDAEARNILKLRAEEAKIELSSVMESFINVPAVAGVNIEDELGREEFNRMIASWIDQTIELSHKALAEAEIPLEEIDHVLLVGGSTLVPEVQDRLAKELGESRIRKTNDPMLAVAYGAALETGLIEEIQCSNPDCKDENGKPTRNPLAAEACQRCGTSLVGIEVVNCPVCFVPTEAHQPVCHKCRASLQAEIEGVSPPPSAEYWRCLECDFPRNPASAERCEMCNKTHDSGGIKCPHCGEINLPGTQECATCGKPIWTHIDTTPGDIGIELSDGSFSMMIPKGSNFDMGEPLKRDFKIPEANQQVLEVVVYQGSHGRVEENEYIGSLLLDLPPGLPKNTPVTIGLGLDKDGTTYVSAQLRDYPERKATARIERTRSSPEARRRQEELLQVANNLLQGREHTPEAAELLHERDNIEARGRPASKEELARLEAAVKAYEEKASVLAFVENVLADADLVLRLLSGYRQMMPNELLQLESLKDQLSKEIARNPAHARGKAEVLENFLQTNGILRVIAYMEAAQAMPNFSPSLKNRIASSLRDVRNAHTQDEADRALAMLLELWNEVAQVLIEGGKPPRPIKPGKLHDSRP